MDYHMSEYVLNHNASRLQENMEYYSKFSRGSTPPQTQAQPQQHLQQMAHPSFQQKHNQQHHHHKQQQQHHHQLDNRTKIMNSRYEAEFYVYEVEFKRGKEQFEKAVACREDFDVGDYVRVEGDRGYEIGLICQRTIQNSSHMPFFTQNGQPTLRKIVGRAQENEKKHHLMKLRDESRALHICNELSARRRLPILMLDAEFQTDRNKLTFLYVSDVRVDFRELVRDLFSLFKTRIWMQKLDIHGKQIHSSMPSGDPHGPPALPQLQHLFAKYGRNDLLSLIYSSSPSLEGSYYDEIYSVPPNNDDGFSHWSDSDLIAEAEPYVPHAYQTSPTSPPLPPPAPIVDIDLLQIPSIASPLSKGLPVEIRKTTRHTIPKPPTSKVSPTFAGNTQQFFPEMEPVMDERNYYTSAATANPNYRIKNSISPGLQPLGYSPATVTYHMLHKSEYPPQHYSLPHAQSHGHAQQSKLLHPTNRGNYSPSNGPRPTPMHPNNHPSELANYYPSAGTSSNDFITNTYSRSSDSNISDLTHGPDDFDRTTTETFFFE